MNVSILSEMEFDMTKQKDSEEKSKISDAHENENHVIDNLGPKFKKLSDIFNDRDESCDDGDEKDDMDEEKNKNKKKKHDD